MATLKQRKAARAIIENGRTSVSAVMREVGYSAKSAVDPSKLTKSKGFQELLEEYIPDELLAKKHKQLLEAKKIHGSLTEPDREVDDNQTQGKMVELGYKVKKKLNDSESFSVEVEIPILGTINVSGHHGNPKDTGAEQED